MYHHTENETCDNQLMHNEMESNTDKAEGYGVDVQLKTTYFSCCLGVFFVFFLFLFFTEIGGVVNNSISYSKMMKFGFRLW